MIISYPTSASGLMGLCMTVSCDLVVQNIRQKWKKHSEISKTAKPKPLTFNGKLCHPAYLSLEISNV